MPPCSQQLDIPGLVSGARFVERDFTALGFHDFNQADRQAMKGRSIHQPIAKPLTKPIATSTPQVIRQSTARFSRIKIDPISIKSGP